MVKLFKKNKLIFIFLVFIFGLLALYGYFQINLSRQNRSPSPNSPPYFPNDANNYQKGIVLVTFNEGTTYDEAKNLLSSLGLEIEGTNGYWKAEKYTPEQQTVLKTINLFSIKVTSGEEDAVIEKLTKEKIVRAATKNYYGHIND